MLNTIPEIERFIDTLTCLEFPVEVRESESCPDTIELRNDYDSRLLELPTTKAEVKTSVILLDESMAHNW